MRKKVGISACLLGKRCRYDGGDCKIPFLEHQNIEWIPVCPEESGGLSTPRPPAEMIHPASRILATGKGIVTRDGTDVTEAFIRGGRRSLEIFQSENIRTALLKSRSPSCGIGAVYDGSFSGKLISGDGVFAKMCQRHGIKTIDSEDTGQISKLCETNL